MLFKRLIDQFNQTSVESLKTTSKMKTLSLLKDKPGVAAYIHEVANPKHRRAMSKFRLSGHALDIERGRYSNIVVEERFCTYCKSMGTTAIED